MLAVRSCATGKEVEKDESWTVEVEETVDSETFLFIPVGAIVGSLGATAEAAPAAGQSLLASIADVGLDAIYKVFDSSRRLVSTVPLLGPCLKTFRMKFGSRTHHKSVAR